MLLLGGGLLSGASTLMQASKVPDPPPLPAAEAAPARTPGATVRVGDGTQVETDTTQPEYSSFVEQRTQGKALGGLGRSGLGL
jgi:hypothetical protein